MILRAQKLIEEFTVRVEGVQLPTDAELDRVLWAVPAELSKIAHPLILSYPLRCKAVVSVKDTLSDLVWINGRVYRRIEKGPRAGELRRLKMKMQS